MVNTPGRTITHSTLLAAIGDRVHPAARASAMGVYRLWRDLGYAIGGLLVGVVADAIDAKGAIVVVAAITAASGVVVALRMQEAGRSSLQSVPPGADHVGHGTPANAGPDGSAHSEPRGRPR